MRRLAIALMTIMLTCEGANAAFVSNYVDWQALGEVGRVIYIYGLIDRISSDRFNGEESYLTARRKGLESCALSQRLTGDMIVTAMTQQYLIYPKDRHIPPAVVFDHVMKNICIDSINTERAKFELPAWKAWNGPVLGE